MSSVHSPGSRPKGPPARNPVTSGNEPAGWNSTAAPRASPIARPSIAPRRRSVCLWSSATALPITRCLHQGRCRADFSGQTCCESRPHCNTSSQARTSCRRRPSGRFPFDLATNCTLSSGHRWRLILHDALLLRVWAWWDVGATHTICYAPFRLRLTSQASRPRQAMRVSYRPKRVAFGLYYELWVVPSDFHGLDSSAEKWQARL